MQNYSEDTLVKRTTADSMGQQFRWRWMLTWNNEDFGSVDLRGLEIESNVLFPQLMNGVVAV